MIILDEYLEIPGKVFNVRVQCVSTRRLTTIEWLIVNCANQFFDAPNIKYMSLKQVFEEIFHLTSSEILIKPCIESLLKEKAILIDADANYDYSALHFSQIRLTEKGKKMAKDGLFPGALMELPVKVYYNPLTKQINQFPTGREKFNEAIAFGTESDYNVSFPEDEVIEGLHKGTVERGRFIASKQRIEAIEQLSEDSWRSIIKLTIDLDSNGNISTDPTIKADTVKYRISELFSIRELPENKVERLPDIVEAQVWKTIGSGKRIKTEILSVCKNSNVFAINEAAYSIIKKNTSIFKDKCVFLWGTEKFSIERNKGAIFFNVPLDFTINGCCIINEKNEGMSLCKGNFSYDGEKLVVPMAFRDRRVKPGESMLVDWLELIAGEVCKEDFSGVVIFLLPLMSTKRNCYCQILEQRWSQFSIEKIIEDIKLLDTKCKELDLPKVDLEGIEELLWEKIIICKEKVQENLIEIMKYNCIKTGSVAQRYLVSKCLSAFKKPSNYSELLRILQAIGIRNREDALLYDAEVNTLYTKELISDVLIAIMEDRYTTIPEFFEMDEFLNLYNKSIKQIELLVAGLHLFEKMEHSVLGGAIDNCVDIALLQAHVAQLIDKNVALLSRDINVYSVLKSVNSERADNFFDNIRYIKAKIADIEQKEVLEEKASKEDSNNRTMYIIDTCALIHNPDILLCFRDDEYVRIPTKVIDELGKIKDKRSSKYSSDVALTARRVASDIEKKYRILFNMTNKMRFMIENAPIDLLPVDLDPKVPDNQILSVALKYKSWNTYIISDDGVFRLTSISQDITPLTGAQFLETHTEHRKKIDEWMRDYETTLQKEKKTMGYLPVVITNEDSATRDNSKLSIDDMSIKELKRYIPELRKEAVISMLANNKVKTIGEFRQLTPAKVDGMRAKGQQIVLRKDIKRAVEKLPEVIDQVGC